MRTYLTLEEDEWQAHEAANRRAAEIARELSGDTDAAIQRFADLLCEDADLRRGVALSFMSYALETVWREQAEQAEREASRPATPADTIAWYVDSCLRRHRSKQPSDGDITEWWLEAMHFARGAENDAERMRREMRELGEKAGEWRAWAKDLRSLAERICWQHRCEPQALPPPGSITRRQKTKMEKLRAAAEAGEVVSTSEIDTARMLDRLGEMFAGIGDYTSYAESYGVMVSYLDHVRPLAFRWSGLGYGDPGRESQRERYESGIAPYVAGLLPKRAQLVAAYALDAAEWLERAAAFVEAQVTRPKLTTV